jgi:beta-glucosidase/6-phospho-beta-glucosidase/beta-galactosidase
VYRLGIDWGRVEPRPGEFDQKALARYRDLLKMIRARNMKVMLTLMHHSVPKWVQANGGWNADRTVDDFFAFARRVIDQDADLVDYWITFNEPNVFAALAYSGGLWPPGEVKPLWSLFAIGPLRGDSVTAMDRMSDAHARVFDWSHGTHPGIKIGFAQNMALYDGKTLIGKAEAAAVSSLMNWRFPSRAIGRMDFFGINYYGSEWIRRGKLDLDPDEEYSEAGRAVRPWGLYALLKEIAARFPGTPIVVTENGIADSTDALRPAYLLEHLAAVDRARREGAPVVGFVWWTMSDNWEWSDGYCPKFGLVAVDRDHGLKRIPRPSYDLFRRVATGRVVDQRMRDEAWTLVSAAVGKPRPFCRADDATTALPVPTERPFSATDWRFR